MSILASISRPRSMSCKQCLDDPTSDDRLLVQSLLSIHAAGGSTADQLRAQLRSPSEHVRTWAIRLLTETWTIDDALGPPHMAQIQRNRIRASSESLLPEFVRMAEQDESPLVRLTLASTLQRLPVDLRPVLAKTLVAHSEDADDHNLPLMIWYGLIAVGEEMPADLVGVAAECRIPSTLRLISRCLAEKIESHPSAMNELLDLAATRVDLRATILTGVGEGLRGWQRATKPANWDRVAATMAPDARSLITELSVVFGDGRAIDDLREILQGKSEASPEAKLAAFEALIQSRPADLRSICEAITERRSPQRPSGAEDCPPSTIRKSVN